MSVDPMSSSNAKKNAAAAEAASFYGLVAAQEQIRSSKDMYNQGREDFAPYRNLAPESLANLQSSIYGTPQTYKGADGVQRTAEGQQFDLANFKPEGTAAYEWQKQRTLEDLGNTMNLMGRGRGSTVQANATARALGDLNASEYERGYSRLFTQKQDYINNLLNMVKTSQGAAASTGTLGQSAQSGINSGYGQIAGVAQQGAQNAIANNNQSMSNLYGGIGAGLNTAATIKNMMNSGQSGGGGGYSPSYSGGGGYQGTMVETAAPAYSGGGEWGGGDWFGG